jgi:long-subunit fatty acid transport protein
MKRYHLATAILLGGSTSLAFAGGLERGSQSVSVIFEEGNYFEVAAGFVAPNVDGENLATSQSVSDVGGDHWVLAGAFKFDISPRLAAALIVNEPYGADLAYPSSDPSLGGTEVNADSLGITGVLKYALPHGVSVYGGARRTRIGGDVTLSGAGYGPVRGYQLELSDEWGTGYLAGVAYEIPEIALRVAATYHSAIDFTANARESAPLVPTLNGTSRESFNVPERWQLEAQTGIAKDTLLTAEVRYVPHSELDISPERFDAIVGESLTTFGDTMYYELGIGRQLTERVAASFNVFHENTDDTDFSPLQPTGDYTGIGIGAAYALTPRVTISAGLRHVWFEGVTVSTQGNDLVKFDDATALVGGAKLGVHF